MTDRCCPYRCPPPTTVKETNGSPQTCADRFNKEKLLRKLACCSWQQSLLARAVLSYYIRTSCSAQHGQTMPLPSNHGNIRYAGIPDDKLTIFGGNPSNNPQRISEMYHIVASAPIPYYTYTCVVSDAAGGPTAACT
jgi:hypothetical protein